LRLGSGLRAEIEARSDGKREYENSKGDAEQVRGSGHGLRLMIMKMKMKFNFNFTNSLPANVSTCGDPGHALL